MGSKLVLLDEFVDNPKTKETIYKQLPNLKIIECKEEENICIITMKSYIYKTNRKSVYTFSKKTGMMLGGWSGK